MLISIVYELEGETKTDLFRSTKQNLYSFQVSLNHIASSPSDMKNLAKDTGDVSAIEIQNLNDKHDVFMANAGQEEKKTFIKSVSSQWTEVELDTPNFYLDLNEKFFYAHSSEESLLSRTPKFPEFMIATGELKMNMNLKKVFRV